MISTSAMALCHLRRLSNAAALALLALIALPASAQTPIDLDVMRALQASSQTATPPLQPSVPAPEPAADAAELLGAEENDAAEPMFGQQLFQGAVQDYGASFNADYTLAIGDRVSLRMWGAFTYEAMQIIDAQGNVFIPNVGPVRLAGVRNFDLNDVVRAAVEDIYTDNVDVYASLEASQPVRVFVTGFVLAPGQYPGVSAESVLGYLARAGGVDPERGSYIDIRLRRGGVERARFDLYDFLLDGSLDAMQIQDGDTIVVGGRHNAVRVTGDVFNAYGFEFETEQVAAEDVLALARPRPQATHVSIVRKVGVRQFGEYYALDELDGVMVSAGDELSVVADRTISTILVRVDGAIESSRVLTLPYGSRLRDALDRVRPTPQAQPEAVQLYRLSVAARQREMLELSLRVLETNALTARSSTSEEATLRAQEAAQITRFIERARAIEPRGQVVLANRAGAMDALLEDGDVLVIPEESSIVMVHGEVTQPNAIAHDPSSDVMDYIALAGGTTQRRKNARILLLRQDGTFVDDLRANPQPGDEILVLPTVGSKNIEIVRGITQILYQLAISARVVVDL